MRNLLQAYAFEAPLKVSTVLKMKNWGR